MNQQPTDHQPTPRLAESKEFKMSSGRFAGEMLFRYAAVWLIALCVLGVAGIVCGVVLDLRYMVLGFMVVFVVIPMLLTFLYYYFGLRREAWSNVLPHTLTVDEKGITAHLRFRKPVEKPFDAEEKAQEENAAEALEDTQEDAEAKAAGKEEPEYEEEIRDEFFPFTAIKRMESGLNSAYITFLPPEKGFLWIPFNAYDDPEEAAEVLKFIGEHIPAGDGASPNSKEKI